MAETAQIFKRQRRKKIIISIMIVFVVALAVVLFFVIRNDRENDQEAQNEPTYITSTLDSVSEALTDGDSDEVLGIYDRGISNSSNDDERRALSVQKAYFLLSEDNFDDSLTLARDIERRWQTVDSAGLMGDIYAAQGDVGAARDAYRTAIDRLDSNAYDYESSRSLYQTKIDELGDG